MGVGEFPRGISSGWVKRASDSFWILKRFIVDVMEVL